jgi:hypothetical protein
VSESGRVEVWQEQDALWRWRYRDDEGVDLLSNEGHLTREDAIHAASVAYPGVRVEVQRSPEGRDRTGPPFAAALGKALLFVLLVAAAIPLGVVLLWRRLSRMFRR